MKSKSLDVNINTKLPLSETLNDVEKLTLWFRSYTNMRENLAKATDFINNLANIPSLGIGEVRLMSYRTIHFGEGLVPLFEAVGRLTTRPELLWASGVCCSCANCYPKEDIKWGYISKLTIPSVDLTLVSANIIRQSMLLRLHIGMHDCKDKVSVVEDVHHNQTDGLCVDAPYINVTSKNRPELSYWLRINRLALLYYEIICTLFTLICEKRMGGNKYISDLILSQLHPAHWKGIAEKKTYKLPKWAKDCHKTLVTLQTKNKQLKRAKSMLCDVNKEAETAIIALEDQPSTEAIALHKLGICKKEKKIADNQLKRKLAAIK